MKYARIERERRFLLARAPADLPPAFRRIRDRYVEGTRLRLRRIEDPDGRVLSLKLGQKYDAASVPGLSTIMTNLYLNDAEYEQLLTLAGRPLIKRRYDLERDGRRVVVDVFEAHLDGLVLAEIEVESEAASAALTMPDFAIAEVTSDRHFTGGALAATTSKELRAELARRGAVASSPTRSAPGDQRMSLRTATSARNSSIASGRKRKSRG